MGSDMKIPIGTSIGAVFVPDEGTNFMKLYHKADQALYKVKQAGKHGCAFYEETHNENTPHSQKNISHMRMILGERNRKTGAYFIELEKFKVLYQFSARLVDNYQKGVQFMQITLNFKKKSNIDDFRNMLIRTLRRSDCITQNGGNQFLVMLMEATLEEGYIVKDRILKNWAQTEHAFDDEISFEIESIE